MPAIATIYSVLNATTEITSRISEYQFSSTSPAIPAIFSQETAPEDASTPLILIRPAASGIAIGWDDRHYRAGLSIVDVTIYDDKTRSSKGPRETATLIWDALHRTRMEDETFEMACFANFPAYLADPDGFPGYVISCNVSLREKKRSES